jgi:hypothetical protein
MNETPMDTLASEQARRERAARRRERLVANRATSFDEAEAWDLEFWQSRTPEERLSAFVHLRRDVQKALAARRDDEGAER